MAESNKPRRVMGGVHFLSAELKTTKDLMG